MVQWYEQPCSVHEVWGSNPDIILNSVNCDILGYTEINHQYHKTYMVRYTSYIVRYTSTFSRLQYIEMYSSQLGILQYISVYLWYKKYLFQ